MKARPLHDRRFVRRIVLIRRAMLSRLQRNVSSLMVWLGWYDLPRPPEAAHTRPGWLPLMRSTAADADRYSRVAGSGQVLSPTRSWRGLA